MKTLWIALFFILVTNTVAADSLKYIELTDGSVITGKIVRFDNGVFVIDSPSLGALRLEESQVVAITSQPRDRSGGSDSPRSSVDTTQLLDLQSQMMNDSNIMGMVMSLQNDPQVRAILSDPGLLNALLSGNLDSAQSDPRVLELMNNPTIKQIMERMK